MPFKKVVKLVDDISKRLDEFINKLKVPKEVHFQVKNALFVTVFAGILEKLCVEFNDKTSIFKVLMNEEEVALSIRINDLFDEIKKVSKNIVDRYEKLPKKTSELFEVGLLIMSITTLLRMQTEEFKKKLEEEEVVGIV